MTRVREFFRTFMLAELVKGMMLTGRHMFARKVTVQFPESVISASFQPVPGWERTVQMATLDVVMQSAAERALEGQLRKIEAGDYGAYRHVSYEQYIARTAGGDEAGPNSPYLQGAFIAMDPRSGAVRALVGGRDFDDSKFNRATQAQRQPGSAFKVFVYLAALEAGLSPWDVRDDGVVAIDGYAPGNFDNKHFGQVTLKEAIDAFWLGSAGTLSGGLLIAVIRLVTGGGPVARALRCPASQPAPSPTCRCLCATSTTTRPSGRRSKRWAIPVARGARWF